jgi:hypothetical protein
MSNDSHKDVKGVKSEKRLETEIRNSKQIQMIKKQKFPNKLISDFDLRILIRKE